MDKIIEIAKQISDKLNECGRCHLYCETEDTMILVKRELKKLCDFKIGVLDVDECLDKKSRKRKNYLIFVDSLI